MPEEGEEEKLSYAAPAPKSVAVEGWFSVACGVLSILIPAIGWGALAGADSSDVGGIIALVLGAVAGLFWLVGVVASIVGLSRGSRGSPGRGLVYAGGAMALFAIVTWVVEWFIFFAVLVNDASSHHGMHM